MPDPAKNNSDLTPWAEPRETDIARCLPKLLLYFLVLQYREILFCGEHQ